MEKKTIRNLVALAVHVTILLSNMVCLFQVIATGAEGNMTGIGLTAFRYYTVDSNVLLAIACLMAIPFDLFALEKRTIRVPMWMRNFQLAATASTTITLLTVVAFLGPTLGYRFLFGGTNLVLHLFSPVLAIVAFIFLDNQVDVRRRWIWLSIVPPLLYGIVYLIMVVGVGPARGGWEDFYGFRMAKSWPILLVVFPGITALVTWLLWKLNRFNFFVVEDKVQNPEEKKEDGSVDVEEKDVSKQSVLNIYIKRVFRSAVTLSPLAVLCIGMVLTIEKIVGWYPDLSWIALGIFDVLCLFGMVFAIVFAKKSVDEKQDVIPERLFQGKILLAAYLCVQWNYITYMVPSRDFWACAIFFVMLTVFFFDHRFADVVSVEMVISIAISWIIRGDKFMPASDGMFYQNLILRIVLLFLSMVTLHFIAYFGNRFLIGEITKLTDLDGLTGLMNRRRLNEFMTDAYNKALASKGQLSIAMMDLDDFKHVNDTLGHEIGDVVLKTVAETIREKVRFSDQVFRWGGEEILILYHSDCADAGCTTESIREAIDKKILKVNDQEIHVTATFGISTFQKGKSIQEMFVEADRKMYEGKAQGKNIVVY